MVSFPICKINLGLNIISRYENGYHNIATCFYPIGLKDILDVVPSDKMSLEISGLPIEGDLNDNLILKAYRILKADFDISPVSIALHKLNPMGAGLGGGSADGAYMLLSLNELFNLQLTPEQLEEYASKLGADCAFFIKSTPRLAYGIGTEFKLVDIDLSDYDIIIAKPEISLSTKKMYSLTTPKEWDSPLDKLLSTNIIEWKDNLKNDFEPIAFSLFPQLEKIKSDFYNQGAIYSSMSGSGSAFYAIFDKKQHVDLEKMEREQTSLKTKFYKPTCAIQK